MKKFFLCFIIISSCITPALAREHGYGGIALGSPGGTNTFINLYGEYFGFRTSLHIASPLLNACYISIVTTDESDEPSPDYHGPWGTELAAEVKIFYTENLLIAAGPLWGTFGFDWGKKYKGFLTSYFGASLSLYYRQFFISAGCAYILNKRGNFAFIESHITPLVQIGYSLAVY